MIFFDLDEGCSTTGERKTKRRSPGANLSARFAPQDESDFTEIWHCATLRNWKLFEQGEISFAEQRRRVRDVLRDPSVSDEGVDEMFARFPPVL